MLPAAASLDIGDISQQVGAVIGVERVANKAPDRGQEPRPSAATSSVDDARGILRFVVLQPQVPLVVDLGTQLPVGAPSCAGDPCATAPSAQPSGIQQGGLCLALPSSSSSSQATATLSSLLAVEPKSIVSAAAVPLLNEEPLTELQMNSLRSGPVEISLKPCAAPGRAVGGLGMVDSASGLCLLQAPAVTSRASSPSIPSSALSQAPQHPVVIPSDSEDELSLAEIVGCAPGTPKELVPTKGAITNIYARFPKTGWMPILEIRDFRRHSYDRELRYAISVADGDYVVNAMAILGSSLVQQVEAGQVALNTLIRVMDFRVEEIYGYAFLLMQAQMLGIVPAHLRTRSDRLQKVVGSSRKGAVSDLQTDAGAIPQVGAGLQRIGIGALNTPGGC